MDTLPITTPRQAGIYVRQARDAQGLTRATLAKKAGVSERNMSSQPTPRMPICNLVAPPGAITLNVFTIATDAAQPFQLFQIPPLRPSSTTRPSPISPCPISESRLPQAHLPKPSPKGDSQWPEKRFGLLFAAYPQERSCKMRAV